ncbi:MAG: substrate-binding domain-containing protein [Verrucomicrobiota bacterium]
MSESRRIPMWNAIYSLEKQAILDGDYPVGGLFSTIDSLAAKHGVSAITARRVLRLLAEDGLVRNIKHKGSIVTRRQTGLRFFLIMPDEATSITQRTIHVTHHLMQGVHDGARLHKLDLQLATEEFLFHPESKGEAFVCHYSYLRCSAEDLAALSLSRKIVLLHPPHAYPGVFTTRCDLAAGMGFSVASAALKGHTRIAFLGPDPKSMWFQQRYLGYVNKLTELNLELNVELVGFLSGLSFKDEEIGEAMSRILSVKNPPTAVCCTDDRVALGVLKYCQRHRISVPRRLAIIGFDNRHEASLSRPRLATIDAQLAACGRLAVETLNRLIDGETAIKRDQVIQPVFIPGETL